MLTDLAPLLQGLLTDTTRLYRLQGEGPLAGLLVESWRQEQALDAPWVMQIDVLATNAALDVQAMLGTKLTLHTRLSDGSEHPRSGIVTAAQAADSDGALARYRLTVEPWQGLLARSSASRVWQEKTVIQIAESLFQAYPHAAWHWADCVDPHLQASANAGLRSYTVQHRQTDLAFLHQLLAREGLAYRSEDHADSPAGHRVVIFADSASKTSCPEDLSSQNALGGRGIRYHRASSQEKQDAVQAFGGLRRLQAATSVALSWDYKIKAAVAATVPTAAAYGGPAAPALEHYAAQTHHASYAWPDASQAQRSTTLVQEALEARHKTWIGRSTVRSFNPGTHFLLTQSDMSLLDQLQGDVPASNTASDRHRYLITRVSHLGLNNLPKDLSDQLGKRLAEPDAIDEEADLRLPEPSDELRIQAAKSGYANSFEAIRAAVPWRPEATANPEPRSHPGVLTATVVGPRGETQASGAEQIHMDTLGRIRIAFDFQLQGGSQAGGTSSTSDITSNTSTWVRVLQRWAGAGMGAQFIPRIGQQVLVDFVGGDIERPVVTGSLYDGQGQGGIPATPAGQAAAQDPAAFKQSTDYSPGAQANTTGGHSPAWHGQAPQELAAGGQRNAAALSGYKSEEFGSSGGTRYNQLVFDDSDQQLRLQLASTQHASQLNLGHLIHQADNHRGSLRGLGFELRTDAYGAIRAGRGVLISSYATQPQEPAGDNAAGMALQGQLAQLSQTLTKPAATHEATQLASALGSYKPSTSTAHDKQAPAKALHTVTKGMVSSQDFDQAKADAADKNNATADDKLPHTTDATLLITAKAGQATVAGQDIQIAAAELIHFASGQDTHIATGAAARIHSGQSIGILAGATGPGTEAAGKGITLIAGQGDIEVQAQADKLQVAAKKDISIQSKSAHIDWAAAKKITLQTAGGASVTIEGGNITVECPGKIEIKAGKRSFLGPETELYGLPLLPSSVCVSCLLKAAKSGAPFATFQ